MDRERLARDQPRSKLRQLPLSLIFEMPIELLGYHQLENGIAQEFQTLVIEMMLLGLVSQAWMGERFREQERIAELVSNAVFQRIHDEQRLRDCPGFSKERRSPVRRPQKDGWESAHPWLSRAIAFEKL